MKPYYKAELTDSLYDKILSKREANQVVQAMEIRQRITREMEQAKRLEQKRYERNMSHFVTKLQDKWN
jgi:hypothetical protein